VVIVESVDVDLDGKPIVTSRARFAAERIEFVIELESDSRASPANGR